MTRYTIILLTLIFLSCKQTSSSDTKTHNDSSDIKEIELTEILLTETKIGNLELDKLNENNILTEIKSTFPDFQITKTLGQQVGPDFNLYQVIHNGQEIFFISMDSYDTTLVQDLWINNKIIKDEYGITVSQKIESALEKRPNLKFHSDLHQNIYATEKNSKIEYRLTGNFKTLNDTTFFADDYSVERWQTEGMEIEYLIWRK
jgi:hypothetical protein